MKQKTPAYFIFNVTIHDYEAIKPYQEKVSSTYKPYGGKALVLTNNFETIEGNPLQGHLVILQFEDIQQAHAWHGSKAYQEILPYREKASTTNAWLVEGIFTK